MAGFAVIGLLHIGYCFAILQVEQMCGAKTPMGIGMAIPEHEPLNQLREICLALPEVVEKATWDTQTYRVRDKIFAMRGGDRGREIVAVWCKAPKGAQEVLVGSDPRCYFLPPYVAHKGWIGVRLDLDDTDWDEVQGFITESYLMTAPKMLAGLIEQDEPAVDGEPAST